MPASKNRGPPKKMRISLIATIKKNYVHAAKVAAERHLLNWVMDLCLDEMHVVILEGTVIRCDKFLKAKRWLFDSIGREMAERI